MWLISLLACDRTNALKEEWECAPTEYDPGAVAPPVDEAAVREVLDAYAPTSVVWSDTPMTESRSAVTLTLSEGSAAPATLVYDEGCADAERWLFVPVLFEVVVGDDDVAGTIDGGVEASSAALSDMTFPLITRGDATLSDAWLSAALSDSEWVPEEWTVSLGGTLSDGDLDVVGHVGESNRIYWSGSFEP